MNININTNVVNLNALNNNGKSLKMPKLNIKEEDMVLPLNKINISEEAVEVAFGESGYFYDTEEEIFTLRNQNRTWSINGTEVAYKNMDNDTQKFLFEFDKVHRQYSSENSGIETQYNFNFAELTKNLGNQYATLRDSLKENFTGDALNTKLEKLNNAFKMYTETKVVGSVKEVGSMANRAHFALEKAKIERHAQEVRKKVLAGKESNLNVPREDITYNDKEYIKKLIENANEVMAKAAEYFYSGNSAIKTDEDFKKFNDFTSITNESGNWSLNKISETFNLFDNVSKDNVNKYTKDDYNAYFKDSSLFSEDEKSLFAELFRINNQ